jgi:DNA-directed RNA polymerase subunit RPC12/RpoP
MIRINPEIDLKIKCNSCGKEFQAKTFHLTGMHVLGGGSCPDCDSGILYKEMPTSAGLLYPTVIDSKTGARVDDIPFSNWFINNLSVAFKKRVNEKFEIKKIRNSPGRKDKLLILNTVDSTYGHSLLNIFNLSYYRKKKDFHLLLIVSKNLLWLVPDYVDEIWVADISFSKAGMWNDYLVDLVNREIQEYRESFLCRSFPQVPEHDFNIEEYTRVKPFPLDEWDKRLKKPVITFIWRKDRFWKRVLPRVIDNRLSRRLFSSGIQQLKYRIQFRWLIKFASELRKSAPDVDFAIAGMDSRELSLPDWIKDFRFPEHSDRTAKESCERYAESHLIIGCNGSSLVLPSCHAGGVMNIVPYDGWFVSVGSFVFRFTSMADTFYRYSLINKEASIRRIVKIAVQILRDRSMIQMISGSPWNDHDAGKSHEDWAKFRTQIFENTRLFNEREGLISR